MKASLRTALISGIITLQIITVGSILFSSYYATEKTLLSYANNLMEMQVREVIERTKSFMTPAQKAAELTRELARHKVLNKQRPEEMKRYFYENLHLHSQFTGIFFGSNTGDFVHVQKDSDSKGKYYQSKVILREGRKRKVNHQLYSERFQLINDKISNSDFYDPRSRQWFQQALERNRLIWTAPYIFYSSKQPGITTAMPVVSQEGETLGVVGVDISINQISEFLAQLKIGTHGKAFIINNTGEVIAYPDQNKIQIEEGNNSRFARVHEIDNPVLNAVLNDSKQILKEMESDSEALKRLEIQGEGYLTLLKRFPYQDGSWIIGVYQPENDVLGTFKATQRSSLLIGAGIAVVACIFGFFVIRSITNPIVELKRSAEQISKGDLIAFHPEYSSFYELNQAQSTFSNMVKSLITQDRENRRLTETLRKTGQEVINRLSSAAEFKDDDTAQHIYRMANYSVILGKELGMSDLECRRLKQAAKMHDIGKLGIPDDILHKPGKLNDEEWVIMREHPLHGANILKDPSTEMLQMARDIALTHHERPDGRGYPRGLLDEEISLPGKIVAVADVFDALTSERCYKKAFPVQKALDIIQEGSGTQFSEEVVTALFTRLDDILEVYEKFRNPAAA